MNILLKNENLNNILKQIFEKADTIIVYRSSPDEKAKVVKYVMNNFDVFTLAIGDGANDVNMI